jgi:hypothetical protein
LRYRSVLTLEACGRWTTGIGPLLKMEIQIQVESRVVQVDQLLEMHRFPNFWRQSSLTLISFKSSRSISNANPIHLLERAAATEQIGDARRSKP